MMMVVYESNGGFGPYLYVLGIKLCFVYQPRFQLLIPVFYIPKRVTGLTFPHKKLWEITRTLVTTLSFAGKTIYSNFRVMLVI